MIRPRNLLMTAAITAVIPFAQSGIAHAASAKSITLSPSSTNLTLLPGVTANRDITIINDGDTPYTVTLSAAPYRVQGETYDPLFTRLPGTTDASAWVTLSQKSLTLSAHQTATVGYTLTAPKVTASGGYYAVVFAETTGTVGGGVSASNRVGDILYMTVDGQVKQGGSLSGAPLSKFVFGSSIPIGVKVTNNGGLHFQTDSHLGVTTLSGKSVFRADSTHYVLPQTTRLISSEWTPASFGGIYKVSRSATVAGANKSLPDEWIVVATPKIIPLIAFIILAIVGFVILLTRTRRHKRG
jgi:hypothetical protein